jgi:hypothetical protein
VHVNRWIRQNFVLIAGIVLPVIIVVLFLALERGTGPRLEPPPQDFIVISWRHDPGFMRRWGLELEVVDGRLMGTASPVGEQHDSTKQTRPELLRFEAARNAFERIPLEPPAGLNELDAPLTFVVSEADGLVLDASSRSPDGWRFERDRHAGDGGFLGMFFGMDRRRYSGLVLSRGDEIFHLPQVPDIPYYQARNLGFVAWVIGERRDD